MKKLPNIAITLLLAACMLLSLCSCEELRGPAGAPGKNGSDGINGSDGVNGANGIDGVDGKSAYELAVEDGFRGTLHEWLLSLAVSGQPGADGKPGSAGKDGVSVREAVINSSGELIITLTDGTQLNAGRVTSDGSGTGGSGTLSPTPDADGYYEVYETVIMEHSSQLNLRATPDTVSGTIVTTLSKGDELLRVGDQRTEDGFSRLVWNGQICYARSKYFEVKYEYKGDVPEIHLPDSIVLCAGAQSWFVTDQILPDRGDDMHVSYSYSGAGERVYDGCDGFAITPAASDAATPRAPMQETLTVSVQTRADGDLRTIYQKRIAVTVVDPQASLALTGIVIGDSRISDGTLVSHLDTQMANLKLLGTRTFHETSHEGRGAWSTEHYWSRESLTVSGTVMTNSFYNPAVGHFDFSYYMQQHFPNESLDFVVINLGANDNFSSASVENLNKIVDSIKAYGTSVGKTVEIMVLTEYLSPATGYYLTPSSNTNIDAKRAKQFNYYNLLDEAFSGREDEGVHLLPNYLTIDAWNDRLRREVTTVNGTEERIIDVVHLNTPGYRKEASMIMAYLYRLYGVQ